MVVVGNQLLVQVTELPVVEFALKKSSKNKTRKKKGLGKNDFVTTRNNTLNGNVQGLIWSRRRRFQVLLKLVRK